jgi:hypothetical protein
MHDYNLLMIVCLYMRMHKNIFIQLLLKFKSLSLYVYTNLKKVHTFFPLL